MKADREKLVRELIALRQDEGMSVEGLQSSPELRQALDTSGAARGAALALSQLLDEALDEHATSADPLLARKRQALRVALNIDAEIKHAKLTNRRDALAEKAGKDRRTIIRWEDSFIKDILVDLILGWGDTPPPGSFERTVTFVLHVHDGNFVGHQIYINERVIGPDGTTQSTEERANTGLLRYKPGTMLPLWLMQHDGALVGAHYLIMVAHFYGDNPPPQRVLTFRSQHAHQIAAPVEIKDALLNSPAEYKTKPGHANYQATWKDPYHLHYYGLVFEPSLVDTLLKSPNMSDVNAPPELKQQ